MAVVYRATQLSLKRVVALKLLSPELGDDPDFRARFEREGQLQAGVDHQHIVAVYEAGESDRGLFLAMRLIPGPTLKELILGGQLDPRRTLRLLTQVAQALDAAHDAGLIHRDIKPQNILIDKGEHVYLADFGLTKAVDDTASITQTGQFLGTIDYASPEQIRGDPATPASDCYALTAVLYECLVGRVPYPEPNEAAVLHAHVVKPPPRPTDRRPELPAGIDAVIARGMAKDPAERPESATELLRLATAALISEPAAAATGESEADGLAAARAQATRVPQAGGGGDRTRAAMTRAAQAPPAAGHETAEETPRDVAPPRPTRPRRRVLLLAGILLAVFAGVGGYLLGEPGERSGAGTLNSTAAVGHLQLHYPSSWQFGASLPAVPGVTLDEPMTIAAAHASAGMTAGRARNAAGPTLLPASFREKVQGATLHGEPVRLGSLEAYRYGPLQVRGLAGQLTVFAVPTTAGVVSLECWDATGSAAARQTECAQIASSLTLVGAHAYELGPNAAYAQALSQTLTRLTQQTRSPLSSLSSAATAAQQASAAQALASAYGNAARELQAVAPPPAAAEAQQTLVAALQELSTAYASAARAARAGDAAAYAAANRAIMSASSKLTGGLRQLETLGYTVLG
jgi:hypothetical protein